MAELYRVRAALSIDRDECYLPLALPVPWRSGDLVDVGSQVVYCQDILVQDDGRVRRVDETASPNAVSGLVVGAGGSFEVKGQ